MPIQIPTISQLTDDQWEVQDLPIKGKYMVTGGPGSGKTSIAIRRTEYIKKDNPKATVQTLLFTKTLNSFFADGIKKVEGENKIKINSNIKVWAKWQRAFLIRHKAWHWNFNDTVPWNTLSKLILDLPLNKMYEHLIIDEGQDFSESDLKVMSLIADNITIFADKNQRLNDRGVGDIGVIKNILDIEDGDYYHLRENHRNTKQIIESAVSFAPEEIDVDIEEVKNTGQKPRIISLQSSDDEIEHISRVVKQNRQKDIGILHLENRVIKRMHKQLSDYNVDIQFELKQEGTFDFKKTNPKLCTLDSSKGLEFDIVIMPQMNKDNYYNREINKKRIYVGMTRPKEELHMSYWGYPAVFLAQIDPNTVDRRQG